MNVYSDINIHANEDKSFRFTCRHGNLSVAQWLHSVGNVNIHVVKGNISSIKFQYKHTTKIHTYKICLAKYI
jgi:hypothetical protein